MFKQIWEDKEKRDNVNLCPGGNQTWVLQSGNKLTTKPCIIIHFLTNKKMKKVRLDFFLQ